MLRHLKDDIKNKSYAHRAEETVRCDQALLEKIKNIINRNKKNRGEAIRSVLRSRNAVIIRARSHSAANELFALKDIITKAARDEGATTVRFLV